MSNISVAIILCSIFLDVNLGSEFQNRTLQLSASFGNNRKIIFVSKGIVNIFIVLFYLFISNGINMCNNHALWMDE